MAMADQHKPHVAMLPTPGMGHLIPLAELAKYFVAHHGFSFTIITFANSASKAQESLLSSLPESISSIGLPPVPMDDVPANASPETTISISAARSVPTLRGVLRKLKESKNLVAFVADLFGSVTFDAAIDVGVPPYLFFPSNFLTLSLFLHLPILDATTTCDFRDLPEPVKIPGCVPIPGTEVLHPLQDRYSDSYRWVLHQSIGYRKAKGILVNTFEAMEPGPAKVLSQKEPGRPPVFAVGPLVQEKCKEAPCLSWLDNQPQGSVLFVCFGSAWMMTTKQLQELAIGLEESGRRFLWVLRCPNDKEDTSAYLNHKSDDPLAYLPEGFLERTKDRGLVVPLWAPQIEVLAHPATGGFLSHCGWNSTLESVVNGVPMIAWPLFAEQKQNAVMLVEETKIALRATPIGNDDQIVGKDVVSSLVKELMEGEKGKKLRSKVRELQQEAAKALGEDGSSCRALAQVANMWKTTKALCS